MTGLIPDHLLWTFVRRYRTQRAITGFAASRHSYACPKSRFAEHVFLQGRAWISDSTIGRWSRVHGRLSATTVGAFCSIAAETLIGGLGRHPTDQVSSHSAFFATAEHLKPQPALAAGPGLSVPMPRTVIGHDVWVAYRAIVLHGLTVGDGAVIAAGSVVTHDVPPFAIVAGVPARVVRYRFEDPDLRAALLAAQWWHWPVAHLRVIAAAFDPTQPLTLSRWQDVVAQVSAQQAP